MISLMDVLIAPDLIITQHILVSKHHVADQNFLLLLCGDQK